MSKLMKMMVGFFKGFSGNPSGLELAAEMVSHYRGEFRPTLGDFVLISLDREQMVLGRITRFFPSGAMSSIEGDEYLASLARMSLDEVPEDIKETKLRYNVHIKLLGTIGRQKGKLTFKPSVRELPHLGAVVGQPTPEVIEFICRLGAMDAESNLSATASPIGHLAHGDTVFDGKGRPAHPVYFDVKNLVGRRTYVFARAGYGKSNLIKLLIAELYSNPALQELEAGRRVGMLIFDPEGEYAFPDNQGRPGLINVPGLQDKLVIYTSRTPPPKYQRWVAGRPRLNLAHLNPAAVTNICIPRDKQDLVFANLLRGLRAAEWEALLEALQEHRYRITTEDLKRLLQYGQESQALAAVPNNLVPVIQSLHDSSSTLAGGILEHLAAGRVVVVDISLMGAAAGERLAGLLLDHIFSYNQERFTGESERLIPTVAVLEEAQSVLSEMNDASPFVRWTKEGRKYQLGSILVTQQPGSIARQLLSQGDNFFSFHLISTEDLESLQSVNAHFSRDVLMHLLNEPIRGNAYMWSAPHQPFVLGARIDSFERRYGGEPVASALQETPAEFYRAENEKATVELDELVKAVIQMNFQVKLWGSPKVDGVVRPDLIGINLFNLCRALAEDVRSKGQGESLFRETPHGRAMRDQMVLDSLKRSGLLMGLARAKDGKSRTDWVLVDGAGAALPENRRLTENQADLVLK